MKPNENQRSRTGTGAGAFSDGSAIRLWITAPRDLSGS